MQGEALGRLRRWKRLQLKAGGLVEKGGSPATILTTTFEARRQFWRWVVLGYSKRHKAGYGRNRGFRIQQTATPIVTTTPTVTVASIIPVESDLSRAIPTAPAMNRIPPGEEGHILSRDYYMLAVLAQHGVVREAPGQLESLG